MNAQDHAGASQVNVASTAPLSRSYTFNAVIFSGRASLDMNSANFGPITGQQNSPRSVQFAMKLSF